MLNYETSTGIAKMRCDACPATLDGEMNKDRHAAMERAVHMAKLRHWKIQRQAGTWRHFCASCRPTHEQGKLL
ncbi:MULTISPECIES: hypothetical protein [unclassified Rhizobium]